MATRPSMSGHGYECTLGLLSLVDDYRRSLTFSDRHGDRHSKVTKRRTDPVQILLGLLTNSGSNFVYVAPRTLHDQWWYRIYSEVHDRARLVTRGSSLELGTLGSSIPIDWVMNYHSPAGTPGANCFTRGTVDSLDVT